MSEDEDLSTSRQQMLTAEYRDGQLQIVDVSPFDKGDKTTQNSLATLEDDGQQKFVQVIDSCKGLMQLDLLNFALVRCQDGVESYEIVNNSESEGGSTDGTVTCMIAGRDSDNNDSGELSCVMMEGDDDTSPLVYLQAVQQKDEQAKSKPLTPAEILERAKALQKAKTLLSQSGGKRPGRSRKRKSDLPPPHELLSSPNFKLFLYSCKMCSFKCNAIKEMTAHKAAEHGAGSKARMTPRAPYRILQCAKCPFRAATDAQLVKHVQDIHSDKINRVHLNTEEVEAADVLVCGACGFESSSRMLFKTHIEEEHGATTC